MGVDTPIDLCIGDLEILAICVTIDASRAFARDRVAHISAMRRAPRPRCVARTSEASHDQQRGHRATTAYMRG